MKNKELLALTSQAIKMYSVLAQSDIEQSLSPRMVNNWNKFLSMIRTAYEIEFNQDRKQGNLTEEMLHQALGMNIISMGKFDKLVKELEVENE